jgi:HK97 family phage prohead protease
MTDFQYDFSGIASKYNTRCNDGRVIIHGAFGDDNGKIVPLLSQHDHTSPKQVLGKALLKETPEGVKAYCSLNDTELGEHTKKCIKHGDLVALSIWANRLHETNKVVRHGEIKEVSVVLAGANPGAKIDNVMIHSDEDGYSAEIRFYDPSEISIFEDSGIMHSEDIYDDDDEYDDEYYDPDDEDYDDG